MLFLKSLIKHCKIPIFIVGHVNKDGAIAGPKVLEHIVDTVLYFEGDKNMSYRILRATKNRFGSTNEIGVFEMQSQGLVEIPNPSQMLLSERPKGVSGSCVVCVMEGTRPILAEVQALVSKSSLAAPRRVSTGFDYSKMAMIIAVLEKRCGIPFWSHDVYINAMGGIKLDEPSVDLAICAALASAANDVPIDKYTALFGEVGLTGEVRPVSQADKRVNECIKTGFKRVILPAKNIKNCEKFKDKIELIPVQYVGQMLKELNLRQK